MRQPPMKSIERLELISKVAREMQSRMTFEDIDTYLNSCGITARPKRGSYDSKWVYAKELLANAPEQAIVRIADELEIPHTYTVVSAGAVTESKFWEPNRFRLFLSHLSSFKATTAKLRASLRKFAISGFVAHEDIEPTKEWQDEIEAALFSMDALVALVTPKFVESKWADQEVGIAIGRGCLVIPVMREAVPHGFIGKFQGVDGKGKSILQVAIEIFETLMNCSQTRSRLLACVVDSTVLEPNETAAIALLRTLASVSDIPETFLERLRDRAARSQVFQRSALLSSELAALLQAKGITTTPARKAEPDTDDEIPF
jgi:hypothetical protein